MKNPIAQMVSGIADTRNASARVSMIEHGAATGSAIRMTRAAWGSPCEARSSMMYEARGLKPDLRRLWWVVMCGIPDEHGY